MIPLIAGIGFGTIYLTGWAIANAGTAGMTYAVGRKFGRNACNLLDSFEGKARSIVGNTFAPSVEE